MIEAQLDCSWGRGMTVKRYWSKAAAGLLVAGLLTVGGLEPAAQAQAQAKFNMSYLFFGGPQSYAAQVDRSGQSLDVVAPSYLDLNAAGQLELSESLLPSFTAEMHQRGIRVVPFLSNHWDRQSGVLALANREALAAQVAAAVADNGWDGVNVDIENVTETERDAYTDFVRLLREKLPAGKEVSVAVAANPTGATKGWLGSYDYAALAKLSDYLMLMAYDESYPGDPTPGPVASLSFVEQSVQAALKLVPADKLVLGIPFYGRYWNGNTASDGAGIANNMVDKLLAAYGGTVRYDAAAQSPVATVTIRPQDAGFSVYGSKLAPGTYTIWYDNEQSIKEKLKLVGKYGLKGSGSWSLNQESAATWSYYDLWLNGLEFADAEGHWAQQDILAAGLRGWMLGTAPGQFAPDAQLTRAQAAAILVRALGLDGEAAADGSPFADVPADHWAAYDIAVAQRHGLIQGIGAGRFAPDRAITREEMSQLLSRVLSASSPPAGADAAAKTFADVPAGRWSAEAIAAMSRMGLVDGFADGTFRPGAPLTRAEMAALLSRAAGRLPG